MEITKVICPSNKTAIKCPYSMSPTRIVVHNTANDASAMSEISYMLGNNAYTSFHYAVDDYRAVQAIEENRNSFNAGDGATGTGNRKGISIEICYSKSGGDRFVKAEQNAVHLIVDILHRYGWGIGQVTKHQDYSGKYCPHRTLDMGWERFINMVKAELNPAPVYNTYKVITNIPVYLSSIDAFNKVNVVTNYGAGNYYIGDEANGMYNISSIAGNKDGWINPAENIAPVKKYVLVSDVPAYTNSINAKNHVGSTTVYHSGEYYIFNESQGTINITKTQGKAGGWINPSDNVVKVPEPTIPVDDVPSNEPVVAVDKPKVEEPATTQDSTESQAGGVTDTSKETTAPATIKEVKKSNFIDIILNIIRMILKGGNK